MIELVQSGHAQFAPAQIIDYRSNVYGLYDSEEELQALCEIATDDSPAAVTFYAASKKVPPAHVYAFIEGSVTRSRAAETLLDVRLSFPPAAQLVQQAARM